MTTVNIMDELEWLTVHHMIIKESIIFIHKVIFENVPPAITNFYTFSLSNSQNIRSIRKPTIKYMSEFENARQSLIYRSVYLYNSLPDEYRTFNPKKLSGYLNFYIKQNIPNNKIPKNHIQ